jgi:3D (Asp-Asp-Asp) domain-containing protein
MNVRTTAYTHSESDHIIYGRKNAVGTPLKFGYVRSAAADWSRFPLGTRFRIAGQPQIYEVDDYGSALVGTGTIDLYTPTRGMMNAWGVRHVDIEVLQWGSFERSHDMLKERTRYPHVRRMFDNIQRQINQVSLKTGVPPATARLAPAASAPLASL